MSEVIFNNVSKSYDGKNEVVHNINLKIEDKEFVVLVGPSGCGKTTILRMVAGLEEITSGEIVVGGKVVNNIAPKDRNIAMVFQNYALYPHMSVYNNIAFGLKLKKTDKRVIEKRVKEVSSILGLETMLKRKPGELSGGQKQRVALGRAIIRNPEVFLFDEPLSNLDAKLRVRMRTELLRLHQKLKKTTIYVTHDQIEAMTMGEKIVVLKDGRIQQVDTPLNIYRYPINKFVAGFIGSPPMNFIKGKLTNENGLTFTSLRGKLKFGLNRKGADASIYNGNEVYLGIRPENFLVEATRGNSFYSELIVTAEVVELMGNEIFLYFNIEGNNCVARLPSTYSCKSGDKIKLFIDLGSVHLFDVSTDMRINLK